MSAFVLALILALFPQPFHLKHGYTLRDAPKFACSKRVNQEWRCYPAIPLRLLNAKGG